MSDSFLAVIPGQPPSWNRSYRIVHQRAKDKFGQAVLRPDGSPRTYSTLMKQRAVADYQSDAKLIINSVKPSDFHPEGFLYVVYDFNLKRDIDCDNVMKAIDDVLAECLGINDRKFLPVSRSKTTGYPNPFVSLVVLDASLWTLEMKRL